MAYSKNGNPIPIQQWLIGQTDILEKACQHSTDCAVKMELVNQLFYLQNQLDVVGADDVECVNALCDGYLSVENTCVYITPKILRLKIGETQPTQAKIMVGSEICTGEIVWGNPYDDISTVDKDGNVTGVKIGSGGVGAWVVGLQFISGEERVEVYYKPEVETSSVTDIQGTSAIIGGNVINDNNDPVTEYGVFWGTTEDPVSTGTKLQIGSGTGSFSTILSELIPGETYFIKAYAINNADIAYGNQVSFITKKPQIILTIRNASSWTTPCLFSLDWEYCLGTLSTVSNAVVKLYASQSSFDNNLPDFTATSDNNGIVNLYVPTPGQYFMLAEKGDLSNIKDGYVIFDVFDDIFEKYTFGQYNLMHILEDLYTKIFFQIF